MEDPTPSRLLKRVSVGVGVGVMDGVVKIELDLFQTEELLPCPQAGLT